MTAIRSRRSVREYTEEPLGRDAILRLIHAAILAPSARNEQVWRFCVITNGDVLSTIARKAKAYALDQMKASAGAEAHKMMLESDQFNIFYHAPALVVLLAPKAAEWATEDCAMAAENLMLAAAGIGLGTCWIGFAQAWLNTPEGRKTIDVASDEMVVAPIIVGHPRTNTPATPRMEPRIHWIV